MSSSKITDLLKKHPNFQYEEAKIAGYTDAEIITFLSEKNDIDTYKISEYSEVPWIDEVEKFSKDYPISFWTFNLFFLLLFALLFVMSIWKIVKLIIYHIVYTIAKAIKDAGH